jgi:glycosyltransferase involved in cell wall biosynthesis
VIADVAEQAALKGPIDTQGAGDGLVSVVMPTHNSALWVQDTIDSLIGQTWSDIELIVVDDASSDSTVETVRRKLTADFRRPWRIIELPENRGPGAARNRGLEAAAGDWVQFLDSDDFMAPEKLALQMAYCRLAPADVAGVYSPWGRCYFDDGVIIPEGPTVRPTMVGRASIMAMVGNDRLWSGANLTRRSALKRIGGFDETLRVWENEELIVRLAEAGRLEPVTADGPLYLWRLHRARHFTDGRSTREENRATALTWIEQMVRATGHRALDQMNLSSDDRADILNATTEWARGLYGNNLVAFRQFLALARKLDPNIGPAYPRYVSILSGYLGYEAAEAIARLARVPKALFRRLSRIAYRH